MRNISGKSLDKVKIQTVRSISVFPKSCRLRENVGGGGECYSQTGHRWQHVPNAAQKSCSLPERKLRQEHRPKLTTFNTEYFLIDSIRHLVKC